MTTEIKKAVKRVTALSHRGKRIVVSIEPGDLLGFREERTRTTYYLPISAGMDMAIKAKVQADRAAKKKQKTGQRG